MASLWQQYRTDTGAIFPFVPLGIVQLNEGEIVSNFSPLSALPPDDLNGIVELETACNVPDMTYRQIILYASDGGQFRINYYLPFSDTLFARLSGIIALQAFELIGERIRYSRLKRIINRG